MPPRATEIIAAGRQLLETEGPAELTMRRLGQLVGIRAPSIYKHLPGKRAVEVALIEVGLVEMGQALRLALRQPGPDGPIASMLAAYRAQGRVHPNLYRLATAGPLPRAALTPGLEDWTAEPWLTVTGEPHLAQALWSFAHGMVILEIDGRYPDDSDLDKMWRAGAATFEAATFEAATFEAASRGQRRTRRSPQPSRVGKRPAGATVRRPAG